MRGKIDVGRTYQSQTRVEEWMTAEKAGNRGVDVLSTPALLQMVEDASMQCLAPLLGDDDITLGTHVDLAVTSRRDIGRADRSYRSRDSSKSTANESNSHSTSFDEREKIAEGTHERYITTLAMPSKPGSTKN